MQHTPLSVITTVLHEEEQNYSSSSPSSTTSTSTSTPTPTSSSASISTSFLFPSVEASVSPLNESQEKSMHLSTAVTSSPTGQQLSPTPTINLSNNNSNAPKKRGSTHKVKSSRRASFQLSNTVNNLAKESGVDHLIGIVDGGEKKKGMRDQINDLKEEIEKKGLTKYIDTVNGYSMNGEIKMLKKVLTDNVNINVSHMAHRTAGNSAATSSKYPKQVSSHQSPSKGGSENMVKTLAELRAAKETIAQLEKKIVSLNEDSGVTGEMEDQMCELEDQLLKANEARVEGISQNTHLQERVSELEDEVGVVTEEATLAIQELERMLDELTEKHDNVLAVCEQKDILIGQFREDNASQKRTIARLESEGKSMSEAIDFIRGQVDEAKIEIAAKGEAIDDAHLKEKSLTLQEAQMRDDYAILHHKYHELTAAHVSLEAEKAVGDSRITLLEEENACLVLKAAEGSAQIDRLENDLKEALLHRDQAAIDGSNDATALEEYRRRFIELEGKHTISLDTLKSENISIEAKLLEAIGRSTEMENELKLSSADLKRLTTEQRACVVAHEGKVHQLESMLETVTMERNEAKDFIQILEEELVAAKSIADFEKKDQSVDLECYTPNQLQQDMEFLSTGPEVRSITELENDQSTGDLENQLNAVKSELVEMEQSYGNLKEKHLIMKLQEEKEHHFQLHELQQKLDEVNKIASKVAPLEATIRVLEGTNNSIQDANEDVREFNGKEEMQNDIDVLLAKMVVAEREFEEVQNEHEAEVNALENSIKSMDKVIVKLESELELSRASKSKLECTVSEQNAYLKEAAESLDESDRKLVALNQKVAAIEKGDVVLRSEMDAIVIEKDTVTAKLLSDNEFNRKRVESLQRNIVKLGMYDNNGRGSNNNSNEIQRLRMLVNELDRKNDFLIDTIEREGNDKAVLKKMLRAAYTEQDRDNKMNYSTSAPISGLKNSHRGAEELWGAMNNTPAFVGHDMIFKLEKLVPPVGVKPTVHNGSVVESLILLTGTHSTMRSAPIDFITLFRAQRMMDTRVTLSVERLIMGWGTQKLYARSKPKYRIVRVDLTSQSLFCLPLNIKEDGRNITGKKKRVLLSLIGVVLKHFDSEDKLNTSEYIKHAECLVCIELINGECLVFQMSTEAERNNFYDGLNSLLVTCRKDYLARLIRLLDMRHYNSSSFLQSIIAQSFKSGRCRFEEITGSVTVDDPNDEVVGVPVNEVIGGDDTVKEESQSTVSHQRVRHIVTKKGNSVDKDTNSTTNSNKLLNIIKNTSKRLSVHETTPLTASVTTGGNSENEIDEASDVKSTTATISGPFLTPEPKRSANIEVGLIQATQSPSLSDSPQSITPASRTFSDAALSSLTKTTSLFSLLNKKDKEKQEVEINAIGNLYGSERAEDRRHSVNLSNEKGKRRTSFSFVSENPFVQATSPEDNTVQDIAKNDSRPGQTVRRRSSLFARTIDEDMVAKFDKNDEAGESSPQSRVRGLSVGTIAKANLLSLSLNNDQLSSSPDGGEVGSPSVNDSLASTVASNMNTHRSVLEKDRRKSLASMTSSPSPSSPSVGAENAKRFGLRSNSMRSNSGTQSARGRSNTSAPEMMTRSTLMTVDSESLEVLRKKAQRRASASRELAAQTSILKKQMTKKREMVESEYEAT